MQLPGGTTKTLLKETSSFNFSEGFASQPALDAAYPSGTETILIAEDMPEVRQLARTTLAQRGYQILEAVDGRAALELAAGHPGTIHLLLTDMVMPAMSGRELAERLQAVRPELKVLYMSGHTAEEDVAHGVSGNDAGFLQKPFAPDALAGKVREILDTAGVS